MKEQQYKKVYLHVTAEFDPDGLIIPVAFTWIDGRKYKIDKVLDMKPRPATKAGGCGNRYTVRINGKERYIFLEAPNDPRDAVLRWFVEAQVAA